MASAEVMLHVEAAYSPRPGIFDGVSLCMPVGSTVADALRASGLLDRHGLSEAGLCTGIWGRSRPLDTVLRERDRVEIYRPLQMDPKEARRRRDRGHRASGAA